MPTPQMPTPAPGSPAAGPPSAQPPLAPAPGQGAPGGPGGIDLSKIIGSIAGGAAKMIPGAVGSVAGAQQAYRQ
jgi:hypothetical protein